MKAENIYIKLYKKEEHNVCRIKKNINANSIDPH